MKWETNQNSRLQNEDWVKCCKGILNEGEEEEAVEEVGCYGNSKAREEGQITLSEYEEIFKDLKKNRATQPDDIWDDKNGGQELKQRMYHLIWQIWEKDEMSSIGSQRWCANFQKGEFEEL